MPLSFKVGFAVIDTLFKIRERNSESPHFEATDFITLINDLSLFISSVKTKLGSINVY